MLLPIPDQAQPRAAKAGRACVHGSVRGVHPDAHFEDPGLMREMVQQAVRDLKPASSPSSNVWSLKEVTMLHEYLLKWLTWVFALVKESGRWPLAANPDEVHSLPHQQRQGLPTA